MSSSAAGGPGSTAALYGELNAQIGLGQVHLMQSRYPQAAASFTEVRRIAARIGHLGREMEGLFGLGWVRMAQGREAFEIFERADELAREIGHSLGDVQALAGLAHSYRLCDRPAEATGSNEAEGRGALRLCRLILANLERSVAIGSMISRKDTTTCFRGIRGLS